jgi:hypothetical protein
MPALSIQPPYPIFTDTDGQPLENGYVWIGTANLNPITNPVAVYWDAAFTQPASQPIRTINGYLSNAGTPARLYPNATDYSILVLDKKGSTVYSAPVATAQPTYVANGVVYAASATELATSGNLTFNGSALAVTGQVQATTLAVTGQVQATSYNGGQLAGMRNKIINGKMEIAQRGTSFPAANNYTLDRWTFSVSGGGAATVSQGTAFVDNEFQRSLNIQVTTADTTIAAGDLAMIKQAIEGYNINDLFGRTFTLSFRVRSSKTGTHCVAFRNAGPDRSYVATYTVNAANTWENKSVTITGGLTTAGTWNVTDGAGLYVDWVLAAGSTWQTTAGSWQTGNFLATSAQVNCLDTIGNIFAITGVQLEVGSVATPFEHRMNELALAQRYFYPSEVSLGNAITTTQADFVFVFKSQMRADPSMTQLPSGVNFRVVGTTSNIGITSNLINAKPKSANVQVTRTSGTWTAGNAVVIAEENVFLFSAEL